MGTYNLGCTFDVTRRIEWAEGDLESNLDCVVDRLHQATSVSDVVAGVDPSAARTTFEIVFVIDDGDPQHHAAVVLAAAIRSCRGAHTGLLTMAEESVLRPEGNQWAGLRTPMWSIRELAFHELKPEGTESTVDS